MWAKVASSGYRSAGLTDHIAKAAVKRGYLDPSLSSNELSNRRIILSKVKAIWHVEKVQNQLGQISNHADRAIHQAFIDEANRARDAIAVALEAVDSAIFEATQRLGLTVLPSQPFTVPTPAPLTVDPAPSCQPPTDDEPGETDAARPIQRPSDPAKRSDVFTANVGRGLHSPKTSGRR
jgi:hypothetical protein